VHKSCPGLPWNGRSMKDQHMNRRKKIWNPIHPSQTTMCQLKLKPTTIQSCLAVGLGQGGTEVWQQISWPIKGWVTLTVEENPSSVKDMKKPVSSFLCWRRACWAHRCCFTVDMALFNHQLAQNTPFLMAVHHNPVLNIDQIYQKYNNSDNPIYVVAIRCALNILSFDNLTQPTCLPTRSNVNLATIHQLIMGFSKIRW